MFASASMRFIETLSVGEPALLRLRLAEINHKSGAQGDLVFVEIDRELTQSNRVRIMERQTIAYRARGAQLAVVNSITSPAATGATGATEVWTPDAVQLFRFSAATFNAHRIHYDLPYTQGEEGYPDLIVHGPLTATKVFSFAQKRVPGIVRGFEFRITAPLFVDQPVRLRAAGEAGRFEAVRCDGIVALSASVGC
jgi:3-methylfumaryl-CoA hydratase